VGVEVYYADGTQVRDATVTARIVYLPPSLAGEIGRLSPVPLEEVTAPRTDERGATTVTPLLGRIPGTYEVRVGTAWSGNTGGTTTFYQVGPVPSTR